MRKRPGSRIAASPAALDDRLPDGRCHPVGPALVVPATLEELWASGQVRADLILRSRDVAVVRLDLPDRKSHLGRDVVEGEAGVVAKGLRDRAEKTARLLPETTRRNRRDDRDVGPLAVQLQPG